MATRNKRKLAALNKENCEDYPRSNLASISNVSRSQEDYITQVSEEIEGRVTKKLSQEFSRTETRILGALARLDDFLMNPLLQGHSGTTPEASRNVISIKQGTNEDDSQSNPHPEAGLLTYVREDRHDMATGDQRESAVGQDIKYIYIYIYTWCPDQLHSLFGLLSPCRGGLLPKFWTFPKTQTQARFCFFKKLETDRIF